MCVRVRSEHTGQICCTRSSGIDCIGFISPIVGMLKRSSHRFLPCRGQYIAVKEVGKKWSPMTHWTP
jgi:hypothetical protein